MFVLGIDAGTQSIKVIVYDTDKKEIIAESSEKLGLISADDGTREQKAIWWIDALTSCFDALPESIRKEVKVISVSGQQHGFVPVSAEGEVLYNVKLWCDTSTAKECECLTAAFGGKERLIKEVGNPILPGYTASKILWLKKNHPSIFNQMAHVMLPHDYLNYYLTGVIVMERGDASGTALMNIHDGSWNEELCALIDPSLIDKLPPIKDPGLIGCMRSEIAQRFGFSGDVMVASGGGDNMMGAIGTGCICDGELTMSLGTSGTLYASSSKAVIDENEVLAAFASSHGSYLPLLCTMNCTVASEVIRKYLKKDISSFNRLLADSQIGAGGLFMLPFLNGERTPNLPNGKGVIVGLTPDNLSDENLCRCAIEGVTFELLLGLKTFKAKGVNCNTISLVGGGANSDDWCQIVADMTGCTVRVPLLKEAAAFGAALQGYWLYSGLSLEDIIAKHVSFDPSREIKPSKENNEKYNQLYLQWLDYVKALTPLFS